MIEIISKFKLNRKWILIIRYSGVLGHSSSGLLVIGYAVRKVYKCIYMSLSAWISLFYVTNIAL